MVIVGAGAVLAGVMAVLAVEHHFALIVEDIVGKVRALIDRVTDMLVDLVLLSGGPIALDTV